MSGVRAYAYVHLSDGRFAGQVDQRPVELNRLHAADVAQRPDDRRRRLLGERIVVATRSVTRAVTRSPRSLVAAATPGGTRRT